MCWVLLMRRIFISVVLGLLALNAFGQMAPDIAKGTSAEEVIRVYGWPKGKSVAEGRESWLYDRFQVMFQQGKVVAVSYIATTTPDPLQLAPPKATVPDPGTRKTAPGPATVSPPAPVRPATAPQVPSPRPARNAPSSDYLVTSPKSKRTEPPSSSGSTTLWVVTGVSAAGILMGMLILAINRREASAKLSHDILEQQRRETFQKRKSWEEEIAEKLRGTNGSKVPPVISAVPMTGATVDTSLAAERHTPEPPVIDRELTVELLRKLEWKRFEQIVALYYGETGVTANCTCTGPDGGVDVKLHRKGEERPYSYIQCKAYGSEKVKLTMMREFLGVMTNDKITEGIFATTSDFYPDARTFAEANGIKLLTAADFLRLFQQLRTHVRQRIVSEVTQGDYTTPSCPACDIKAIPRERKRDGVKFWACRCGWTMNARALETTYEH